MKYSVLLYRNTIRIEECLFSLNILELDSGREYREAFCTSIDRDNSIDVCTSVLSRQNYIHWTLEIRPFPWQAYADYVRCVCVCLCVYSLCLVRGHRNCSEQRLLRTRFDGPNAFSAGCIGTAMHLIFTFGSYFIVRIVYSVHVSSN